MWDDILGHEQNKEFLARLLQPGNRPHALLFYGPEGIGKKQLALRFAKTFLCQKPDEHPCGRCESCRLINLAEHSFAHPDFILVEQEAPGKDLKIEQIKEMSRQAAFAPALSSHKVCVIDAADRMTVEAANSLLKLLEEPPPNWMFILVASRLERLLPTILSRVIQLRFDQIPLALTQEALNRLGLERRNCWPAWQAVRLALLSIWLLQMPSATAIRLWNFWKPCRWRSHAVCSFAAMARKL